ncbi:ATP-binding protein [Actinomadura alba]|uniref:ATP-binding protein n=1 Tax=Actinomadura alba TaxID=406431 RepID=A0ABR7LZ82_9ACTN|nr:ATP-binding protein [Actinomadura alba]MBC6470165.1 ATP-binding protein [Actinomadura alba]
MKPIDQLPSGQPSPHAQCGIGGGPIVLGSIDFPAEAHQVRTARHWLRELLGKNHPAVSEVELLGSELITNSILHSDSARLDECGRPGFVSVTVLSTSQTIRVEVTDAGSASSIPRLVDGGPDAVSGRGLRLLREITGGRYGMRTHEAGRTMWFELDCSPAVGTAEHCASARARTSR